MRVERPTHMALAPSHLILRWVLLAPAMWPSLMPSSLYGVISPAPHSELSSSFTSSVKPSWHQARPIYVPTWGQLGSSFSELCHNLLICVYNSDSLINNGHLHLTVNFTKAESKGLCLFVFLQLMYLTQGLTHKVCIKFWLNRWREREQWTFLLGLGTELIRLFNQTKPSQKNHWEVESN